MYGRLTGNARHLTNPANKIYYATMEEGFYEVDVRTLAVTELFRDDHFKDGRKADLPGRHGKASTATMTFQPIKTWKTSFAWRVWSVTTNRR